MQGIKTSGAMRLRWYFRGNKQERRVLAYQWMLQQLTERMASHCLSGSDAKQYIQNGGGVLASSEEFLRTHHR